MAHPSARLSVFSRQLLVKRVVIDGWPVATVAEQLGISRATAYKWVRRYRADGLPGLEDRSSRPHRSPRRSSDEVTAAIISAAGPATLRPGPPGPADRPSALDDLRRPAPGRPQPPARHRPGDRCPGPLRRLPSRARSSTRTTRSSAGCPTAAAGGCSAASVRVPAHRRVRGYDHLEVFVDDASRYAVVVPVADERGESAAWAVELAVARFAEVGIRIERMLTDNGASYRSHAYRRHARADLEIRHKRTRPYRPQTNGKAERFIQTLLNEWAYARPYRSNGDRLARASAASSTSTITDVRTPRSAASCPARLSTTSPNTTA